MSYQDPYDPYATQHAYEANQSSEKMVEEYPNTQRAQPGRSGLRNSSWAEMGPPPRSTGILRMWRKDERGSQWTRGGGFRSSMRMLCCCVTITLIIVISVILAVLLYIRPPRVTLNNVTLGNTPVSLSTSGLSLSFSIGISVSNPNWFSIDFSKITASARYPGVFADLGGGTLRNVNFGGHTASTFDFPFTVNYTTAIDPDKIILTDLISKCGSDPQDITIDYDLDLQLKILGVSIDPQISSSASFTCPISASEISKITDG